MDAAIGLKLARLRAAIGAPADGRRMSSSLAPVAATAPAAVAAPSLGERLARVGAARQPGGAGGVEALARLCGARPAGDDLLVVETRLPLPFILGRTPVTGDESQPLALPLRRGETLNRRAGEVLFLDTETSGLAGGTGTIAFLLGLARVEGRTLMVRQYLATRFSGEAALLSRLRQALSCAACIVTFNGKSFDVPLLEARFALRREARAFGGVAHCDLLHASRRHLRQGWPDCRLRTVETLALGLRRVDDLPGSEVPAVWQRWLTRGEATGLPRVLDHNREDLVSLLALVQLLGRCEGRLPLFPAGSGRRIVEREKKALQPLSARVKPRLQDPQAVEVLV